MIKRTVKKEVNIPTMIDMEVFQVNDGTQFESQELALAYEKLIDTKQIELNSEAINSDYFAQNIGKFELVYFQNGDQIEAYEQKMCNGEDKTYRSWISCQDKFVFPCWIMCRYVPIEYDDSYIAVYMTMDEVKKDLKGALEQIDQLI